MAERIAIYVRVRAQEGEHKCVSTKASTGEVKLTAASTEDRTFTFDNVRVAQWN